MTSMKKTSRRTFLKQSTPALGGVTAFHVFPSRVIGEDGRPAPSDTIVLGNIGVGGRGSAFVRPGMTAAVCDVDENHLKAAGERMVRRRCTRITASC